MNLPMLVGYICHCIKEDLTDLVLQAYLFSLSDEQQARVTQEVSRMYGSTVDKTPPSLAEYCAMKARMKNVLEMLWPVQLEMEHKGKLLNIRYIVSAQPDPKAQGWWYIRLPDWSVVRFKPEEGALDPMHKLVFKTHMAEFFKLQRKLIKEQRRWSPDLDTHVAWKQVMLQTELMGDGSVVSFSHEPFDAHQVGLYHLEDKRTRRVDYEWGKAGDPMDAHQKGKKVKALIDGKIPVDIGKLTIGGVKFDKSMLKNPKQEKWTWSELEQMVRWEEMPLVRVDYPEMFSVPKKLSGVFENCYMPEDVGLKFATRLGNNPYWKVKDSKRKRWYIYSYDWRTERKTFAHSVIPIGHIEPYRKKPGEYYFTMYSEATLAERRNQSLFIADYERYVSKDLAWKLGLKKKYAGQIISFSVYNDWAAKLWRELGIPATPKLFTATQLSTAETVLVCA